MWMKVGKKRRGKKVVVCFAKEQDGQADDDSNRSMDGGVRGLSKRKRRNVCLEEHAKTGGFASKS